jgi:hypothetical protein
MKFLDAWLGRAPVGAAAPSPAQLRDLADRCALVLERNGKKTIPYRDPASPHFEAASPALRLRIESQLTPYVETLEAMSVANENANDSKRHLWRMLSRLGLTPQPDVVDLIEDDDVVEIYDLRHRQVFRNLRFFDFISMSIEELLTLRWTELTDREAKITFKALAQVALIYTGQMRKTLDMSDWPVHVVTEKVGERRRFELRLRYGSPVRKSGEPAGYIVINRPRAL